MRLSKIYTAFFLSLPTVSLADNNVSAELAEISVIASKDAFHWANHTSEKATLNKNQLLTQQPTSTADAIKRITNVDIAGSSRSIAQKPIIRGLSGNRVVQVIDGVRQNFDLSHRGSYFLPMALTQEIEVIKGPTSTLWGNGALGGIVAIRTPNALDLLKDNQQIGAKIHQGYQSANSLSETDVSVFAANDKFDGLVSGFYNHADDLRLADSKKLVDSRYTQKGGLFKFGWQINDENRLELSHRLSHFEQIAPTNNEVAEEFTDQDVRNLIGNWHRNNPTASFAEMTRFYEGLTSVLGSVSYRAKQKITDQSSALHYYFTPKDNDYINSQLTLYRNSTKEKEQRIASGLQDQTKLSTMGLSIRNSTDLNWLALNYGMDFISDRVVTQREKNATTPFRPNNYDAKSKNSAFYLLTHIPLWNERIIVSPSVRYDHFKTQSDEAKYSASRWSPSIAVTWKATNWLDLSTRYNEAFRTPSMQERFVSGSHFGTNLMGRSFNNTFVSNPNLRPETAKNKEIAAKVHFDNLFVHQDKFIFNATYFQNDVKDFIHLDIFRASQRDMIPSLSQYRNVENARLTGFELEFAYQQERFALGLNYAQTKGKNRQTQEALSNIPANKLGFTIDYALVPQTFMVGANITHYASQKRVPKTHAMTYPSYTLTDLKASYTPSSEWRNLRLDMMIENVFDKKFQPAFSLMEGAGRNIKLNASYQF
ncbi:TonB-dependent hemoglobin/transferrin/lactoferrin family receptor [Actinobacillus porcinus]|uniref:Iron-regulated outer membrane protein n=1 Tax=Actinobacillus porcinus TaxID=51048 RepID=A0ABY6TKL8_9PAST|nr:TonB-dependent hemoglobin/transferrin/lactoferrin family receptor [Actinobacillus porcinus]VFY93473.1 iron-regulated outer membrane protein [Actinobacillus porcinus]VTU08609.1 iron-regulated outer membrane protein [Actinobacillus porcinus]